MRTAGQKNIKPKKMWGTDAALLLQDFNTTRLERRQPRRRADGSRPTLYSSSPTPRTGRVTTLRTPPRSHTQHPEGDVSLV